MSATAVGTRWNAGNLEFLDKDGDVICTYDGVNRKLTFPAGAVLDVSAATGSILLAAGEIGTADIAALAVTEAKLAAANTDGLNVVRVARATYDFAVNGGTIGAKDLGVTLPAKAIILDGLVDVVTTCTTAGGDAGTMAIHVEGAGDIVAAVAVSDGTNPWDAGRHDIIPVGTAATSVKTSQARNITATIAGQAFTAGKFHVFLRYVVGS